MKPLLSLCLLAGTTVVITGCANKPPSSLYGWGSYQEQVYNRFKTEASPQEQIAALEEGLQKNRAANKATPPGYHAHLGMLYGEVGKEEQMLQEFMTEKTLFPESAAYMDFLMRNAKK